MGTNIPILWRERVSFKDIKWFALIHTASKGQSQDLHSSLLTLSYRMVTMRTAFLL